MKCRDCESDTLRRVRASEKEGCIFLCLLCQYKRNSNYFKMFLSYKDALKKGEMVDSNG